MGERKKISLTELDESSIVASFKEEQPAQGTEEEPPVQETDGARDGKKGEVFCR